MDESYNTSAPITSELNTSSKETSPSATKTQTKPIPTAAVIVIGNEILSGTTQDINIQFIAKRLLGLGINLEHVHVIADVEQTIIDITRECAKKYTYVFTTGGIGPTHDDITAAAMAKAFNTELFMHPDAVAAMHLKYGEPKDAALLPVRLRMAMIPKGAGLLANSVSAAPGFYIQNVFVLPGFPEIMRAMFDEIVPLLTPGPKIYSKTVQCMIAESAVADGLAAIQNTHAEVTIGSYPYYKNHAFGLNLIMRGINENKVLAATKEVVEMVKAKGGEPQIS